MTDVGWPGRLELIRLDDGGQVLLDAAHNVDGARALAAYLGSRHPERPVLVIGVMRDKDVDGIIGALLPVVSSVIATAAPTSRAIPARDLAARITGRRSRGRRAHRARPGDGGRTGPGERPHGVRCGLDLRRRGGSRRASDAVLSCGNSLIPHGFFANPSFLPALDARTAGSGAVAPGCRSDRSVPPAGDAFFSTCTRNTQMASSSGSRRLTCD